MKIPGYYFSDPASPFMSAIIDLHDYVFMFLVGVLIFVFYIVYVLIRNNRLVAQKAYWKPTKFFPIIAHFFYLHGLTRFYSIFVSYKLEYYATAVACAVEDNMVEKFSFSGVIFYISLFFLNVRRSIRVMLTYPTWIAYLRSNASIAQKLQVMVFYQYFITFDFIWKHFLRFGSSFAQFYLFYLINSKLTTYVEQKSHWERNGLLFSLSDVLYKSQLRRNAVDAYKFVHHDALETIWTVVPSIILIFIAIPSLLVLFALDEIGKPVLTVKAVGHQWYWSYEVIAGHTLDDAHFARFDSYMTPTSELKLGDHRNLQTDEILVLPANAHIRILVTSLDVLHSWTVPAFGIKVDAVPGRLNQLGLFIDRIGTYYGQCSEICGPNHGFMPIQILVKENIIEWLHQWYMEAMDENIYE